MSKKGIVSCLIYTIYFSMLSIFFIKNSILNYANQQILEYENSYVNLLIGFFIYILVLSTFIITIIYVCKLIVSIYKYIKSKR